MREFAELSREDDSRLLHLLSSQKTAIRLELRQLAARSTLRLVDSLSNGLSVNDRNDLEQLARLHQRKSKAYERLAHLGAPIRLANRQVSRLLEQLKLRRPA
jgi:hypothetical protein